MESAKKAAQQAEPGEDERAVLDELAYCIKHGHSGPRTHRALVSAHKQLVSAQSGQRAVVAETAAARDVLAERARQISAEGWTPAHDDEHVRGQMAEAAGCYAMFTAAYPEGDPAPYWPWDKAWWKPKDKRRNLVRAGALILAEIERLDRAAAPTQQQEGGK